MSHPLLALGDDLKREGEGKAGSGVRYYLLRGHWNGFSATLPLKPDLGHLIWLFRAAHLAVLAALFCASAQAQRLHPLTLPPHPTPSLQKPLLAGVVSPYHRNSPPFPLPALNWLVEQRKEPICLQPTSTPRTDFRATPSTAPDDARGAMCQCFPSIMETPFIGWSLTPIYLKTEANRNPPGVRSGEKMNQVPLLTNHCYEGSTHCHFILFLAKCWFYIVT